MIRRTGPFKAGRFKAGPLKAGPLKAGPLSLRGRLVAGGAVLATLAVLASQIVGVLVVRSWLLHQVDRQLADFPPPTHVMVALHPSPAPADAGSISLPSDFRVAVYDGAGQRDATVGSGQRPGPALPDNANRLALAGNRPTTIAAVSGDGHWRVRMYKAADGSTYVVGLPLDTLDGATSKMLWFNALVLAVTVIALIGVNRWVVRLGLRPLTRMEHTAGRITAGDLDLRVRDVEPRTEIGRLGAVLNTMLDRLQEALRKRQASEDRLRQFVADAGHELRTPLTTIQGFAQLALRGSALPTTDRAEADRLIAQNAERMSLLIDDLLLLTMLDEKPVYRRERVDLLAIAAETISAASSRHHGHPVSLHPLTEQDDLEPVVTTGDAHRLRQVATNLLDNALTHTALGTSIEVRVGIARSGPSGGTDHPGRAGGSPPLPPGTPVGVLEVSDEGPGLTAEEARRVFERFYRVDPARSRDHGGAGLGLSIASAIAAGHGGRLEVDAAAGSGCTFRLVLPFDGTRRPADGESGQ